MAGKPRADNPGHTTQQLRELRLSPALSPNPLYTSPPCDTCILRGLASERSTASLFSSYDCPSFCSCCQSVVSTYFSSFFSAPHHHRTSNPYMLDSHRHPYRSGIIAAGFNSRIHHGISRISGWQGKSTSSGWSPVAFMAIARSLSTCEIEGNNAGLTGSGD